MRSIEFEKEYFIAVLTILNYFETVSKNRLLESQARVCIEQEELKLTLVIKTTEGEEERIEKFLDDYTLAVIGEKTLEDEYSDDGYTLRYQTNIFAGMSGSPIFNRAGRLVGINGRTHIDLQTGGSFIFGIPIRKYSEWKNE